MSGTVQFSSNNFFQASGETVLDGGILAANANGTLSFQGGKLSGAGTINGVVSSGAEITPGPPAATIVINDHLTLMNSSTLSFELGGQTQGTQYDFIDVNTTSQAGSGKAQLDGALALTFINGFETSVAPNDAFTLMTTDAPITGAFDNVPNGGRLLTSDGTGSFVVHYGAASSVNPNNLVIDSFATGQIAQAPGFPAVVSVLGLLGLWAVRRARRHRRPRSAA